MFHLKNFRVAGHFSVIDRVVSNVLENVNQPAYKLGHSTDIALLLIKNEVHLALSRAQATVVVLLDQSEAF